MVHIKPPDPGLGPLDYERLRERVRLEISFLSVESLADFRNSSISVITLGPFYLVPAPFQTRCGKNRVTKLLGELV